MSKSFKLDDIKAAAERQYQHTDIEIAEGEKPVRLLNALQLSEDARNALKETPEGDEETQLAFFQRLVKIVAEDTEGAEKLIEAFGENLAYYVKLIEFYNQETEAGEA